MAEDTQILIRFVTKLPQELKISEAAVAVPISLKRYGLSQTINSLLGLDPPRPFDFLINEQLLRHTLQQHLLDNQLSAETTLVVEYIPAVVPPKHQQSTPHDDWLVACAWVRHKRYQQAVWLVCHTAYLAFSFSWPCRVSSVDAASTSFIVSGSYDGNVRIWNGDMQCQATCSAHSGGVNSVVLLPSSQGQGLLLSSGKDNRVCLWKAAADAKGVWSCHPLAQCLGHTDAVEGVAVNPAGTRMVSCGWDGALLLWRTGAEVEAAANESVQGSAAPAAAKKRKLGAGDSQADASGTPALTEQPSGRLEGHLHCVSSAVWPSSTCLYSGGWDHSVRRWDVNSGINTDTYNGSKVVATVASCGNNPDLVAFGGSDRALRIWDSRSSKGEGLAVQALASHTNWINCIRWSPSSAYHIATASHDHSVKLWDIRGTMPLATLTAHTDKALCVAWVPGSTKTMTGETAAVVSGGADCTLQMYANDSLSQ